MEWIPKNWKQILIWIALVAVSALAAYWGLGPTPVPDPPLPIWQPPTMEGGQEGELFFGWHKDEEAVKKVAEFLPFKVFSDTPAGKADDPLPDQVYMWHAYRKIYNKGPPSRNQGSIGSCVSFGTNTAIERTMVVDIALKGANYEYKDIAQEVTYAGSRVEVGKGRIRGDGSVGAWAAEFVKGWGVVAREKHLGGKYDLSTYDISRCRSWGNSGVPDDLEPVAREHPVKEITLVKTWADAKKALASGYGIAICSGVGFKGNRDQNGVKTRRGSWPHCMALDGYHIENGREYGHIENSWGERPNEGPVGWGDPPTSGFWVASSTIQQMLNEGDSWAFSTVVGFPSQKIDWFVFNRPRPAANLFARLKMETLNHALRN